MQDSGTQTSLIILVYDWPPDKRHLTAEMGRYRNWS